MQGQSVSVNVSQQNQLNGGIPMGTQVILKMNETIPMNSVGKYNLMFSEALVSCCVNFNLKNGNILISFFNGSTTDGRRPF